MKQIGKIILLFMLLLLPLAAAAADRSGFSDVPAFDEPDAVQELVIYINSTTKVTMAEVPCNGYLEVYSILGVKIKSVSISQSEDGCYIDLPKGIYILKAGKSSQKVIVK